MTLFFLIVLTLGQGCAGHTRMTQEATVQVGRSSRALSADERRAVLELLLRWIETLQMALR
jgi:hypothetical protein